MLCGVARLIANHRSSPSSKARQKSGPFPPPALPGLNGTVTPSDSRPSRRHLRRWRRYLRPLRVSPDYPDHPSDVPCPLPRWITAGACVGCFPAVRGLPRISAGSASTISLSGPAQASLTLRPIRLLSRPRATFVARLQPGGLPRQAACQLPDQTDYYLDGFFLHW